MARMAPILLALIAQAGAILPPATGGDPNLSLYGKAKQNNEAVGGAEVGWDHAPAFDACRNDERSKPITNQELKERFDVLKWARPWQLAKYAETEKTIKEKKVAIEQLQKTVKNLDLKLSKKSAHTADRKLEMADAKANIVAHKQEMDQIEQQSLFAPKSEIKKIFFVNLDTEGPSQTRRSEMEKQLDLYGTPYERHVAKSADDILAMPQADGGIPELALAYSKGGKADYLKKQPINVQQTTTAIYLSQAELLKKIADENPDSEDIFIIMEDDVDLKPEWKVKLEESLKTIPADWDIARFVYWGAKRCEDEVPNSDWMEVKGPSLLQDGVSAVYQGNTAYAVRPKSVRYIMEALRNLPMMDIDGAMESNHGEGKDAKDGNSFAWGMHTYALKYPLGDHKYSMENRMMSSPKQKLVNSLGPLGAGIAAASAAIKPKKFKLR